MKCPSCEESKVFLHKGMCLDCLWLGGVPVGVLFKTCTNCGVSKPVDMYKGKDNTCGLCRKLMKVTTTRYSHKVIISKDTMLSANLGHASCYTCERTYELSLFPSFSFECIYCWGKRNIVEIVRITGRYDDTWACRCCGNSYLISSFPLGRLICRSCINATNSKGCT